MMIKQYLFYTGDSVYSHDLRLVKQQFFAENHPAYTEGANPHIDYYLSQFRGKEISALLIMVIEMDPANGVTNIIRNEYMTNPLKKKIIINEKVLDKRKASTIPKNPWSTTVNPVQFVFDELHAAHQVNVGTTAGTL